MARARFVCDSSGFDADNVIGASSREYDDVELVVCGFDNARKNDGRSCITHAHKEKMYHASRSTVSVRLSILTVCVSLLPCTDR